MRLVDRLEDQISEIEEELQGRRSRVPLRAAAHDRTEHRLDPRLHRRRLGDISPLAASKKAGGIYRPVPGTRPAGPPRKNGPAT